MFYFFQKLFLLLFIKRSISASAELNRNIIFYNKNRRHFYLGLCWERFSNRERKPRAISKYKYYEVKFIYLLFKLSKSQFLIEKKISSEKDIPFSKILPRDFPAEKIFERQNYNYLSLLSSPPSSFYFGFIVKHNIPAHDAHVYTFSSFFWVHTRESYGYVFLGFNIFTGCLWRGYHKHFMRMCA